MSIVCHLICTDLYVELHKTNVYLSVLMEGVFLYLIKVLWSPEGTWKSISHLRGFQFVIKKKQVKTNQNSLKLEIFSLQYVIYKKAQPKNMRCNTNTIGR